MGSKVIVNTNKYNGRVRDRSISVTGDGAVQRMESTEHGIDLTTALIVEDNVPMQRRLHRLLVELIGSSAQIRMADSIAAARSLLQRQSTGMALIDIGLPDGSGIELIAWLHEHCPLVTTVVISAFGDEETVLAALRAGAIGYLLKERDDVELSLALKSIQRGGAPIDPFIARRILTLLAVPAAAKPDAVPATAEATLSKREFEVLQLVARGYSNREIAELTTLSRFTIEGYTKTIYRKLAVRSRTAAIFEAKNMGLLH
jgi:DNA-binding NarL/FixJ family response regulator